MAEDFLSWSMDEIEMKQKLGKEIKAVTGDEAIQKRPEMSLKAEPEKDEGYDPRSQT